MSSFAIFRFPRQSRYTKMVQEYGEPERVGSLSALNGKSGFVVAPFEQSPACPVLLIHPDRVEENDIPQRADCSALALSQTGKGEERELYAEVFAKFHRQLEEGRFSKIVLSRRSEVEFDGRLDLEKLFFKACHLYPRAFVALVSSPLCGTWLMATPEVLLSGEGLRFSTMALAGTMELHGDSLGFDVEGSGFDGGKIVWSKKNIEEQHYVEAYLEETIKRFSTDINKSKPYTARAGNLVHRRTDFSFTLADTSKMGSLIAALHPTPAVCGMPKDEACRFIIANESSPRSYYSGFSGPLMHNGATHLYVSLRCMSIGSGRCSLYAGGGLLRESDEQREWDETEAKMKTMMNVLRP